jgi:type IV secretion system protein VirB10
VAQVGRVRDLPRGTLRKGTLIPAVLGTAIHTDLAGDVVARVTRDVMDSRNRCVLIPQDAMLYGTVGNQVIVGQDRGAVAWTEVQLDGSRTLELPGLPQVDRSGAAGVKGSVSNHYGRVFGAALLLSAVGAGAQLGQPAARAGGLYPSSGEQVAGAVSAELSRVAGEFVRRNASVKPTLQVPINTAVWVLVNRDYVVGGAGC